MEHLNKKRPYSKENTKSPIRKVRQIKSKSLISEGSELPEYPQQYEHS